MAALLALNIASVAACDRRPDVAWIVLLCAVPLHVTPIALWKYAGLGPIPLGLSFVTFLLVSALIDIQAGAPRLGLVSRSLYALFFASVTAGPVTRYRDLAPQLATLGRMAVTRLSLLRGASLLVVGLAKIAIVGRPLQDEINGILLAVEMGATPTMVEAWYVVIAGLLALYFLFSGYSDMALGIGAMIGLSLASNFDSPFKARTGVEFVERWHQSLMAWIRVYIFLPIAKGILSRCNARKASLGFVAWASASLASFAFMGAWHGSGWPPLAAGLVAGLLLILFRLHVASTIRLKTTASDRHRMPLLLFVLIALVALPILVQDWAVLLPILTGLVDLDSLNLGRILTDKLTMIFPQAHEFFAARSEAIMPLSTLGLHHAFGFLLGAVVIVTAFPNTLQIFELPNVSGETRIVWRPNILWGVVLGALALASAMVSVEHVGTGFVYNAF